MIHAHDKSMRAFKSICVLSICVLISISGCIYSKPSSSGKHGFTAMEKYPEALNISRAWKIDSALSSARGIQGFNDGRVDTWVYIFISPSTKIMDNGTDYYNLLEISLHANGSYEIYNNSEIHNKTVINWNIDSDQAFQIMMNRTFVKRFVKESGVHLQEFVLSSPSFYSEFQYQTSLEKDDAVWYAEWTRSSEFPLPLDENIWISANNGTILLET